MFFDQIESYGASVALVDEAGRELTYMDLAAAASAAGEMMGRQRAVVLVRCSNTIESVIAYLGALRARHVPLLVDANLNPTLCARLVEAFPVSVVATGATSPNGAPSVFHAAMPTAALSPMLGALLSTSGSTGSPKLVRLSSANLEANARAIALYLRLTPDERPALGLGLHYSYGLSVLNSHLAVGARIVLTQEGVTTRKFWTLFSGSQATSLAAVPTTWEMLRRLRIESMSLPSLRYCTQAGGRLATHHVDHFRQWSERTGRRFYVMYGQTEATARISFVPPDRLGAKLGSIGIAIPGGCLSLDLGGAASGAEAVGELLYSGPNVMLGYAERPEDLERGDDQGGILRTGDLGRVDEDGFFYIVGRINRFIKINGLRVSLDDVEQDLRSTGLDCAAVGEDDQLMVASVNADPARLQTEICQRFRLHHRAVQVITVADLPRSSAGKLQYGSIKELFVAGTH